jgi:hypothetical protein
LISELSREREEEFASDLVAVGMVTANLVEDIAAPHSDFDTLSHL